VKAGQTCLRDDVLARLAADPLCELQPDDTGPRTFAMTVTHVCRRSLQLPRPPEFIPLPSDLATIPVTCAECGHVYDVPLSQVVKPDREVT